jgi:hypothetical protein
VIRREDDERRADVVRRQDDGRRGDMVREDAGRRQDVVRGDEESRREDIARRDEGFRRENDGRRDDGRRDDGFRREDGFRRPADVVRREWERDWDDDDERRPFRRNWWNRYAFIGWPIYSPWRYTWWHDHPHYWWTWTPGHRLTNWFVFGWDRPYYWNYGPSGHIYYQDNYIYQAGRPYLPVNQYYQQIHQLAHSVPQIGLEQAERMEWAPLGVFAMTRSDADLPDARVVQVAVSREGVISGTYYNKELDQVHPISGMVDEQTQKVAWHFADGHNPPLVMETSIYNLTQPETTMLVHYGPNDAPEVWQLVRLEQPGAEMIPPPPPRLGARPGLVR